MNYMTEGWYSCRNIKVDFKKLFTVARNGCFPSSEPGALIWIAFYPLR